MVKAGTPPRPLGFQKRAPQIPDSPAGFLGSYSPSSKWQDSPVGHPRPIAKPYVPGFLKGLRKQIDENRQSCKELNHQSVDQTLKIVQPRPRSTCSRTLSRSRAVAELW